VTQLDPASSSAELEGLAYYDGNIYYHEINNSPRTFTNDNILIADSATLGATAQTIDNSLITDEGTVILNMSLNKISGFPMIVDSVEFAGNWVFFSNSTGFIRFRIDPAQQAISPSSITAGVNYKLAFSWVRAGSTVVCKVGINGVWTATSGTGTWVATPAGGLWLGGENAGSTRSDIVVNDQLLFNKQLSDAELLDAYNNFDDFYVIDGSGFELTPESGVFTYSGGNIPLALNRILPTAGGVFSYGGNNIPLSFNRNLPITSGTFSYSGSNIPLALNRILPISGGVFSYSGSSIPLAFDRELTVTGGSFSYTGSNIVLTYSAEGGFTLSIDGGVFTYSGDSIDLVADRVLSTIGGTLSYSGGNISLALNRVLPVDAGTYSYSGGSIALVAEYTLNTTGVVYNYTGGSVGLTFTGAITVLLSSYTIQYTDDYILINYAD
jgi:hypothetical protein